MKMKHFFMLMVLCGGLIAIIAYHVGANSNWLTTTQTTFSDLGSSNHANQMKATMRDAMINKLSHRAENHEIRLQVHAQSSNYPNLTNDQLSFSSFLSSKNNNMLTAQMWDGLVGKFTTVLTNHEMRLRCIQDGSCLKNNIPPQTPPTNTLNGWIVGEWSKRNCVNGKRTRSVTCPTGKTCSYPQPSTEETSNARLPHCPGTRELETKGTCDYREHDTRYTHYYKSIFIQCLPKRGTCQKALTTEEIAKIYPNHNELDKSEFHGGDASDTIFRGAKYCASCNLEGHLNTNTEKCYLGPTYIKPTM